MKTAIIPFEGVNWVSVYEEETGNTYVAVNPIIDFFGLDRTSQHRKLKRMAEEKGIALKTIPLMTKGGKQETLVINLYHLPAYLYSIQQSKIKPELRPKLREFQIKTTQIINDYWNKKQITSNLPEHIYYGKVKITPTRAQIIEKITNFVGEVSRYDQVKAVKMMNKLLKAMKEKPLKLPIPPEEYLPQYDWLTTDEVAIYFGVSTEAVRNWIKQRRLFAVKYKGRIYISRNEFIYFTRRKEIESRPKLTA